MSSSSSDSDSDYPPPAKRPTSTTYRSTPSSTTKVSTSPAVPSTTKTRSTTFPLPGAVPSATHPFSSRAVVTDSDSEPSSSPLESSESPQLIKPSPPLPICRKRGISSSSSSSSSNSVSSASSAKSVLSSLTNSKKMTVSASKSTTKPVSLIYLFYTLPNSYLSLFFRCRRYNRQRHALRRRTNLSMEVSLTT